MTRTISPLSACEPHNHYDCIEHALATAKARCRDNKARLTPLRERVLRIIWQSHRPVGAYDVLSQLSSKEKVVAPPTVYRAIDFLMAQGLVHRIASQNAYIGCNKPDTKHLSQILICSNCGVAIETHDALICDELQNHASDYGFIIEQETIEFSGRCARCQGSRK